MKKVIFGYYLARFLIRNFFKMQKLKRDPSPASRKSVAFDLAKPACAEMIYKIDSSIIVTGVENVPTGRPVVFAPNHEDNFDIPLLFATSPLPIGFIAKHEIKKLPLVRTWMNHLGCLFINRDNGRESLKMMMKYIEKMDEKGSLVLFPEGTRNFANGLHPFKSAGISIFLKRKIMIVPVSITGTTNAFKKGTHTFTIHYHPPLSLSGDLDDIEHLREVIESGLTKK